MKEHTPIIGKLICNKLKEQGRTTAWLAKKMCCDQSNIYKIYKKTNIDLIQLIQISIIMEFNFLDCYSQFIRKNITKMDISA
ncbi:hypothetical protein AGMMS50262_21870 [Bacteroidia bacterium]|nr:hypothetical protein AGMMS50262_21870 [Bacteroidia bacterium]